ncbi:CRISPR-associated helicase Cas3' [Microbulbifer halophilus]|uniref:CRISPR-associated helicase Cas3 n=1 Tax=Microbulbifer halophilus TaxID=453963 RepID=A0ABW5ECU6_9GAMM|nr:CRISPR-associated helicase Cas3' [Microbulbifer halophilus]MCW8125119.1 CRISPR-associated helicase Cas3' [Microbulbifer halophilus]
MSKAQRNDFYAHSTDRVDKVDWQSLSGHLSAVGKLAAEKASYFGGESLAQVEGLLHDLGKYTEEFQQRLEGSPVRVDHATHGAVMAVERYGPIGQLLAFAIAGHHAGLANGRDNGERTSLKDRLRKELPQLLSHWQDEIELPEQNSLTLPKELTAHNERGIFQLSFLGRMLFSCLVDADYLDTEAFYLRKDKGIEGRNQQFPSLAALREQLDVYLSRFNADSEVNRVRARILRYVREGAALEPGLFSLNVPTGGGKTLASLAFALDHAIAHGLRRVIFVIPFTSIVEQNAAVFREALGELGEKAVLEHHSAFIDDDKSTEKREARDKLRLAMENWEAPIIVTTSVQLFESLYANRGSRCRKLHNIAGSVVILDEAQTLPLKLLMPCVTAMDELSLNYRTSLVLCTATQPALKKGEGFVNGLENVRELAPAPEELQRDLERVQVHYRGPLEDEELVAELAASEQVLCIVNSRRHARSLYQSISHLPGACHLTTLMCARHRSAALKEIRQRLEDREPCRLIATSLIEAGVDVDFPTVYRAEAGLDSIAQAAGRCNREGRRPLEQSKVYVFAVASDWPTPPDVEQFAGAARSVFRRYEKPLSLDAIRDYFRELYWVKGKEQLGADMLKMVEDGRIEGIPYEKLAGEFRMIDSPMLPVIIPYDDEARDVLRQFQWVESCGGLARRLQPYLVQLPEQALRALQRTGAVQPVRFEQFGEQFMELVNGDLYHEEYGLDWDSPSFISAEKSVM